MAGFFPSKETQQDNIDLLLKSQVKLAKHLESSLLGNIDHPEIGGMVSI